MRGSHSEIKITAKTLAKAIKEASQLLKCDEDEVEYRVISKTNGGFLSFIGKKIEIMAKRKSDRTRQDCYQPVGERTDTLSPLTGDELESLKEDLRSFCAGICGFLSDASEVKVTASIVDGRLILDIDDEYLAVQIGKNSKLAEAMEHILRKKPRYLKRELPFRIFVDVRGLRRERENGLVELAKDLSEKVNENKRPIVLNYKSSYDRKIIHVTLDKDERVYTKSIGTGPNRKLMILPIRERENEDRHHNMN